MSLSRLSPSRVMRGLGRRVRTAMLAVADAPPGYAFLPAPSIVSQTMRFQGRGRELVVEAGHSTPLYETIHEVVDYDCYQLRSIAPADLAGSTLIDIGANIGVTTLCLASHDDVQVLAFEPDPRNAARLAANVERNGAANVRIVGKAVADVSGRAAFRAPRHEDVGGRLVPPGTVDPDVIEVETIAFREVLAGLAGRIGLVKIDCEGGEYALLDSLDPEHARRLERLTFEVHDQGPERNVAVLIRRLQALGYTLSRKPDPFGRRTLHHVLAVRGGA